MTAKALNHAVIAVAVLTSGAAHAQTAASPPPFNVFNNPGPPSAEPTDRGGGPAGPAIKRSSQRGELPSNRHPVRMRRE